MKKIILMGNSFCGKTTPCQRLAGKQLVYKKTQAIEVVASAIDTPGEYLENRGMYKALVVTAVEADVILFVQDATDSRVRFSPGQASMFANLVVGVVTKTDLATEAQVEQAESLLRLAGASRVFRVRAVTGEGMEELTNWLSE